MGKCNWVLGRPARLPIGVLILCVSCIGTAIAGLPQGYVTANLLYTAGAFTTYVGSGKSTVVFKTLQAAASADEAAEQSWEVAHTTYRVTFNGPIQACPASLDVPNPNFYYINGAPLAWCANSSWIDLSSKVTWTSLEWVATTATACPLSDGTTDIQYDGFSNLYLASAFASTPFNPAPPGYILAPASYLGPVTASVTYVPLSNSPGAAQCQYYFQCLMYVTEACKSSTLTASIVASPPVIPKGAVLDKAHHVLTESDLTATVTHGVGGSPASGVDVTLQSSRPSDDTIYPQSSTTDSNGVATGSAETHANDHDAMSVITATGTHVQTVQPANIAWLPAKYVNKFRLTCYAVAHQSLDTTGPMVTIPGLPGKYHESFYKDIQRQGSGVLTGDTNGPYIQRNWALKHVVSFKFNPCPYTARGVCATAGETIAVDPGVIPMSPLSHLFSDVTIGDGVGNRTSEDIGQDINVHHIDVFLGRTAVDYVNCLFYWQPNNTYQSVTLDSYVH